MTPYRLRFLEILAEETRVEEDKPEIKSMIREEELKQAREFMAKRRTTYREIVTNPN